MVLGLGRLWASLARWVDNTAGAAQEKESAPRGIDWLRVLPFMIIHLGCLGVLWVGWSPVALAVCLALYLGRMFFITGFYHRYFSHRAYKTSRPLQFLFAVCGNSAVQRGPLWWAAHHRRHHVNSDEQADVHSPVQHGFMRSHVGWFLDRQSFATRLEHVPDLARFGELRWLDRFDATVPLLLAALLYALGAWLERSAPALGTSGAQMLVWGFFVSTTVLYHATFSVNSLAHVFGTRPFETRDNSRNNPLIALFTLGEGWHNNHHRYPGSPRQGLRWWELDPTWWGLRALAALGLIWDLKAVPQPPARRQPRR